MFDLEFRQYLWHGERHLWLPHLSFLSQVYKKIYLSFSSRKESNTMAKKKKKKCTSEQGGQSPAQQRRLQAWRPQFLER